MSTERTQTIAPAVASATATHAAVTLTTSAQTVTTGITNPDVYRCVSITGNQASVTGNVTITGTDWNGATITDTIAASGTSTVAGVRAFKTVTSLAFPVLAAAGDTISIGRADKFGFYGDVTASGDVILTERAASGATEFTIEANGTVNTSYNTITATIVAGDRLRWTYLDSGYTSSGSSTLFSIAEARAFDRAQLASDTTYPDATITAAETRIRAELTDICQVYFVPTSTSEWHDGDGTAEIILDEREVTAVTACVIYDSSRTVSETFDDDDILDLAIDSWGRATRRRNGTFLTGHKNIHVTYSHGYATVPEDIKRAALIVLVNQLCPQNMGDRTVSWSSGGNSFEFPAQDGARGRWYGLPEVYDIIRRYNRTPPGLA